MGNYDHKVRRGAQSIALPSGFIMKMGYVATPAATGTITFAIAIGY